MHTTDNTLELMTAKEKERRRERNGGRVLKRRGRGKGERGRKKAGKLARAICAYLDGGEKQAADCEKRKVGKGEGKPVVGLTLLFFLSPVNFYSKGGHKQNAN